MTTQAPIPNRELTDAEETILLDGETPAEFERDLKSLSDIARNPLTKPLATLAALAILTAIGYQAVSAAVTYHPLVGGLVVVAAGAAYLIAKRIWAIQHRHILRELAREGELDKIRKYQS